MAPYSYYDYYGSSGGYSSAGSIILYIFLGLLAFCCIAGIIMYICASRSSAGSIFTTTTQQPQGFNQDVILI